MRFFTYRIVVRLHQEQMDFITHCNKRHKDVFENLSHVVRSAINHFEQTHKKECDKNGVKASRTKNFKPNGRR